MKVRFYKSFTKSYVRLNSTIKRSFENRLKIFCTNPYQAKLCNHPLKGKWQGYRSINISEDFRAIYKSVDEDGAIFVTIGTHSQLYG